MKTYFGKYILLLMISSISSLTLIAAEDSGTPSSLTFNLDACASYNFDNTNSNYNEFTAQVNNGAEVSLSVVGNTLYRINPEINRHSCTPGLTTGRHSMD